jgi:hypothetical protein
METTFMRRLRQGRRRAFIESYAFPGVLRDKVSEELGIPAGIALEGLREWYLACLDAPRDVLGMPSRAVDVAWHEMILMTRIYTSFCERAFGHYLHHSPEAVMDEPMTDSLARTLAVVDARSAAIAGVPLLFAIDDELGLEDGHSWAEADVQHLRDHRYYYGPSGGGAFGGCATVSSCGGGCGGGGCGGG